MKKIISLILLCAVISAVFISCGGKTVKVPKAENDMTVFTLGGKKINYDYVKYIFLNTKADFEYGEGSDYWESNPDALNELKAATLETIVHNRAIEMLAERYKVTLTEEEKKSVNDLYKELKSDKAGWEEAKKENYLTDYSFVELQRFSVIWGKIYTHLISLENGIITSDDKTVLDDVPINFRNIRYVYIAYDKTNKAEKTALAEEVLAKANAGEDFIELIKTYGEDTTMANYINVGYYYTVGSINQTVENEAEKLEIGEISPIVDVKDGFFIIQRIALDLEYAEKNVALFADQYLARRFNEMVAEIEKDMEMVFTDFWNGLTLDDIK